MFFFFLLELKDEAVPIIIKKTVYEEYNIFQLKNAIRRPLTNAPYAHQIPSEWNMEK